MREICLALVLASACVGCAPTKCGWDNALAGSDSYSVSLDATYPSTGMTASYSAIDDLTMRPLPSCGGLDEVTVGATFAVHVDRTTGRTADVCSLWPITITSPTIASTGTFGFALNDHPNELRAGVSRVFASGCAGGWEFTVHAPHDDPFATQVAGQPPVVLAYRVFFTSHGSTAAACAALLGMPAPAPTADFVCGDAFVATMTAL